MTGLGLVRRWLGGLHPVRMTPQEGYALWAENYPPRPHNPLMEVEQAAVRPILEGLTPRKALDLGTGTGRNLALLRARGARLAVGLDLSTPLLAHHERPSLRICADATQLPFRNPAFDLITSSLMVGDVGDLQGLVGEMARVLVPGGHVIYSDFHPTWSERRWRRTFRAADGRDIELPYCPHTMDAHLEALDTAGLKVRAIREPRINGQYAVVVFHARRL
jgi:malonyl-CoA O-methyltransferase